MKLLMKFLAIHPRDRPYRVGVILELARVGPGHLLPFRLGDLVFPQMEGLRDSHPPHFALAAFTAFLAF